MRVTNKDLEKMLGILNRITGNPEEPTSMEDGRCVFNVGCYHLDIAYGGVAVVQAVNTGGGVRTIMHRGTKKEIYYQLAAMIEGVHVGKGERV